MNTTNYQPKTKTFYITKFLTLSSLSCRGCNEQHNVSQLDHTRFMHALDSWSVRCVFVNRRGGVTGASTTNAEVSGSNLDRSYQILLNFFCLALVKTMNTVALQQPQPVNGAQAHLQFLTFPLTALQQYIL